jgi:GAF domain-containing protein
MEFAEGPLDIDRDSLADLSRSVTETARTLFTAGSVTETLASVVNLAVTTIDGCDYAGLFLLDGEVLTTPVRTDAVVGDIDELQRQANEGPCLDAIAHGLVFYAEDLTNDLRWPRFAASAAESGIRSVLALPVTADARRGALNLYARFPIAFGVVDRAKAAILASLASLALSAALSQEVQEHRELNFQAALSSRATIGEAMGILMERERISSDQAFGILRRASQHLNIKLREVAQNLVDTGQDPETGPQPPL